MMKKIRCGKYALVIFLLCIMYSPVGHSAFAETKGNITFYIWDFIHQNPQQTDTLLAGFLTSAFETAFINACECDILERRNLDQLLSHKEMEQEIQRLEQIPPQDLATLKAKGSNGFLFGVITDDLEGNEIRITVTAESFDHAILAKKTAHISPRRDRDDPQIRRSAMERLANDVCAVVETSCSQRMSYSPEQVSSEKPTGMSKTKIGVIGAGAAALVGGGIALAGGGDDGNSDGGNSAGSCGGTRVGGYCWYLTPKDVSCTAICASHEAVYDEEGTENYAGPSGTDAHCLEVLQALNATPDTDGQLDAFEISLGCHVAYYGGGLIEWHRGLFPTTAGESADYIARACACSQ